MNRFLYLALLGLFLTAASALAQVDRSAAQVNLSAARPHDPNRAEVLMLVLTRAGFVLPSVTVEAGQYVIMLDDRSGRKNLNVQLERAVPGVANSIAVTDGVPVKGRNKF